LSPKREDVPLLNLPSISAPWKFEYDTKEWQPKCSKNEGISDFLLLIEMYWILFYLTKTGQRDLIVRWNIWFIFFQ
jgi:hypothetical protein